MVNIKTTGGPATSARGQDQSLAQLVQGGSLLPVISGEALEDLVLGGHDLLVGSYADHIGYPLGDRSELHKMVKYRSLTTNWKDRQVKQDYLDMVGNCVYALAGSQSVPADQIEERIPAARVPMVELATAAAYLVLLGYVIYTGGDYVDAPKLEKLGRVPGVLHVVETGLAVQP